MRRRDFCAAVACLISTLCLGASMPDTTELFAKGWTRSEVSKILADFQAAYGARLGPQFSFTITRVSDDEFHIHFPAGISPPYLAYLVNYVQYPKGVQPSSRSIAVLARVTLSPQYPVPNSSYVGKRARIYVPSDDHEFDLVYIAVDSEVFQQSFTNDKW